MAKTSEKVTATGAAGRDVVLGGVTYKVWLPWGRYRQALREVERIQKQDASAADLMDYMTEFTLGCVKSAKGLHDGDGKAVEWGPEALDECLGPNEVTDLFAALMNPAGDVDGNPSTSTPSA